MSKKPKAIYRLLCATCDKAIPAGPGGKPPTVSLPEDRPYNHKVRGYDCKACADEKRANPPPPPPAPMLTNLAEIEAAQEEIRKRQKIVEGSIAAMLASSGEVVAGE